jgi:hypothetical protein
MRPQKPDRQIIALACLVFFLALLVLSARFINDKVNPVSIILSIPSPAVKKDTTWNTYTDDWYGFSFNYPSEWPILSAEEIENGKPVHATVDPYAFSDCINAQDYLKRFVPTKIAKIKLLNVSGLDGFWVEDKHLYTDTPGTEAFLFNCPVILRISFSKSDSENNGQIIQKIVASVKFHRPPQIPATKF